MRVFFNQDANGNNVVELTYPDDSKTNPSSDQYDGDLAISGDSIPEKPTDLADDEEAVLTINLSTKQLEYIVQ